MLPRRSRRPANRPPRRASLRPRPSPPRRCVPPASPRPTRAAGACPRRPRPWSPPASDGSVAK
ncbi:MAG: hypothetical protein DWQ37_07170 [Planctomycetota bacterium]|nr:MAG: hypothetical protein DWQ37_07170 [Planctomycetota bacterium]